MNQQKLDEIVNGDGIVPVLWSLRPHLELERNRFGDFVPVWQELHNLVNISTIEKDLMMIWHTRVEVIVQTRFVARTFGKIVEYQGQDETVLECSQKGFHSIQVKIKKSSIRMGTV